VGRSIDLFAQKSKTKRCRLTIFTKFGLPPVFLTPRLGEVIISEMSDGEHGRVAGAEVLV